MKYSDNMTDNEQAQLLAECNALDAAYARAEEHDRESDEADKLDAYGHMNWTVGDEDYLCCLDAVRTAEGVAYHVVINCETGGWIDTVESGTVTVAEADTLRDLPWRYADTCVENEVLVEPSDVEETVASWGKHLDWLAAQDAPEAEDEDESDGYAELRRAALDHRGQP